MSDSASPAAPAKPTSRNALVTFLVPMMCFVAAPPLGNFLGQTAFRMAPTFALIAGALIMAMHLRAMTAELNSVTGNSFSWWGLLVPIYGLYWAAVLLPKEMSHAKKKASKSEPRGAVVYLFLTLYAYAADLNDLAE